MLGCRRALRALLARPGFDIGCRCRRVLTAIRRRLVLVDLLLLDLGGETNALHLLRGLLGRGRRRWCRGAASAVGSQCFVALSVRVVDACLCSGKVLESFKERSCKGTYMAYSGDEFTILCGARGWTLVRRVLVFGWRLGRRTDAGKVEVKSAVHDVKTRSLQQVHKLDIFGTQHPKKERSVTERAKNVPRVAPPPKKYASDSGRHARRAVTWGAV